MKIGLDIHGVIDIYPEFFRTFSFHLMTKGHEVFIVTGQKWEKAEPQVKNLNISYNSYFSIVDYHLQIKTPMKQNYKNEWWMEDNIWNRSKGDFAKEVGLNIHFDDSRKYLQYFPDSCAYIWVPKTGFDKELGKMLQIGIIS